MNSDERLKKVKTWLSHKENLALVAIILIAFIIRVYFLSQTIHQPLWWDEAEYMSAAKHFAFDIPNVLNAQRPPLFQMLSALVFVLSFGESLIRILFVLLPSTLLVFFIFLLGKELYNSKTGLIAALLAAFSWTFIFWTTRVQPDFLSMCFQCLAIIFMWKFFKENKSKLAVYAGIFSAIGLMFKVSGLLIPFIFIIFIFIKDRFSALKIKGYYLYALSFIICLVPYFIWSFAMFHTPVGFIGGYSNQVENPTLNFAWYTFNFFYNFTEFPLFWIFIIGLVIALKFLLYSDLIIKDRKLGFDADIFSILTLLVVTAFYVF